jgi:hypothetical protein
MDHRYWLGVISDVGEALANILQSFFFGGSSQYVFASPVGMNVSRRIRFHHIDAMWRVARGNRLEPAAFDR